MRTVEPRSRRAAGLYTLVILTVLYASVAVPQELRRIHYGTTTSTAHLPIWVAKDAGLFAKNGLNVEPIHIRGGALITMGIMGDGTPPLRRATATAAGESPLKARRPVSSSYMTFFLLRYIAVSRFS